MNSEVNPLSANPGKWSNTLKQFTQTHLNTLKHTLHNSVFISRVNRALKAKCMMHNFHFIDSSSIKKEHIWKSSLQLNR